MSKVLSKRPSPATLIALVALVFAMGTGGAVAFTSQEQRDVDHVFSDEIVNGAVKKQDVRADAVGRFEVLELGDGPNAGLHGNNIAPNALGAGQVATGSAKRFGGEHRWWVHRADERLVRERRGGDFRWWPLGRQPRRLSQGRRHASLRRRQRLAYPGPQRRRRGTRIHALRCVPR
ncbi:MAG: hypothetical protein M3355_00880 [Actinomycetota bacterium]|nr:hypothetical protein [Actinomycetota bacterium]